MKRNRRTLDANLIYMIYKVTKYCESTIEIRNGERNLWDWQQRNANSSPIMSSLKHI